MKEGGGGGASQLGGEEAIVGKSCSGGACMEGGWGCLRDQGATL
jgi:hypothetical protein